MPQDLGYLAEPNPLVDFAFKLVLGSPEHSGITIHFLNSILVGQPRITEVEILNPFLGKEFEMTSCRFWTFEPRTNMADC